MVKKIGLILLNLAALVIGVGYPYLETRLSGQIAATFNSRLLGIATAVKAAFYVLLLAEGLLAMHLALGSRRGGACPRFVPIVKVVRLLAAAAAAALFVFAVYPPQTASLALLAAMQTVDLLLLGLSFMLRKKEQ